MAKGRRLTTSRSELYLGTNGFNPGQQTVNGASDFGEDEVWSTVHDGHFPSSQGEWDPRNTSYESNGTNTYDDHYSSRRRPPRSSESSASRHRHVGGLSLAFDDGTSGSHSRIVHQFQPQDGGAEDSPRGRHMATSAPVNVPDWSRVYRVDSDVDGFDDGEENNREAEIVPPHEYLARSRGTAFEGVGLSLKGRNLSRVRDAVWSQTGFYG